MSDKKQKDGKFLGASNVPDHIFYNIDRTAAAENRTRSGQVIQLISEALEARSRAVKNG